MPEYIKSSYLFRRNVCFRFFRIILTKTYAIEDIWDYDPMTSDSGKWDYSEVTTSFSSNGCTWTSGEGSVDHAIEYTGALPSNFEVEATFDFGNNGEYFYWLNSYWITRGRYSGINRLMVYNTWPPNYYVNSNALSDGTYILRYENGTVSIILNENTLISYSIGTSQSPTLKLACGRNVTHTIKDVKIRKL